MANEENMPRMSEAEQLTFRKYLDVSTSYLEYGIGGSTHAALQTNVSRIVSVESDPKWISRVRESSGIKEAEESKRLTIIPIDIGPVGAWGYPTDKSKIEKWPRYSYAPFELDSRVFEFVLVDGRFRVSCALMAAILSTPGCWIAVHDYTVREQYRELEKFLELTELVDTLAVFRRPEFFSLDRCLVGALQTMFSSW